MAAWAACGNIEGMFFLKVLAYASLVGVQRGRVKDDKRRDFVALKLLVRLFVKDCE